MDGFSLLSVCCKTISIFMENEWMTLEIRIYECCCDGFEVGNPIDVMRMWKSEWLLCLKPWYFSYSNCIFVISKLLFISATTSIDVMLNGRYRSVRHNIYSSEMGAAISQGMCSTFFAFNIIYYPYRSSERKGEREWWRGGGERWWWAKPLRTPIKHRTMWMAWGLTANTFPSSYKKRVNGMIFTTPERT